MKSEQRFVFDTNTLISAACFDGSFGRRAYEYVRDDGTFLVCEESIAEFSDVLFRPKFDRFSAMSTRRKFFDTYRDFVDHIKIPNLLQVCRDPTGDKFLELAVVGQAKYLVTRDKDLLVLGPFQGVQVLDAERLVALLAAQDKAG